MFGARRGYGRAYEKLDDGLLREDAVKDIGSLLDWIATQPDLDSSRVAVSGGSYGGYMVLASLVRYGDRLCAGIDWMGFADFQTSIQSGQPSALAYYRHEYGDERDPKMRVFFEHLSPLRNAGQIRKPLLIVHGSNDVRVKRGGIRADRRECPQERNPALENSLRWRRARHQASGAREIFPGSQSALPQEVLAGILFLRREHSGVSHVAQIAKGYSTRRGRSTGPPRCCHRVKTSSSSKLGSRFNLPRA